MFTVLRRSASSLTTLATSPLSSTLSAIEGLSPPLFHPPTRPDSHPKLASLHPSVHSAVGIFHVERNNVPHILMLHRAAHMRSHPNQLSFVGGKRDAEDETLLDTLLREADEEIGLGPEHNAVIHGSLPRVYPSLAGLAVAVYVGSMSNAPFAIELDESQAVLEIPLAVLADKSNFAVERIQTYKGPLWHLSNIVGDDDGVECIKSHGVGDQSVSASLDDVPLWGLSARILYDWLTTLDPEWADPEEDTWDTRPSRLATQRAAARTARYAATPTVGLSEALEHEHENERSDA